MTSMQKNVGNIVVCHGQLKFQKLEVNEIITENKIYRREGECAAIYLADASFHREELVGEGKGRGREREEGEEAACSP